jgi:hypothetical protein
MMTGLLHTHSLLRYFILIMLVVVIVKSLMGLASKKPYGVWDNKFSLYLLIFTHLQLVAGLILYFTSDVVQFNSETMKTAELRYWAVEHIVGMLLAVVLITVARISSKKMTSDQAKHKRMVIFNGAALLLIVSIIYMSGRGIL